MIVKWLLEICFFFEPHMSVIAKYQSCLVLHSSGDFVVVVLSLFVCMYVTGQFVWA
jgi:putative effector of murein hydrolase LrgA (UPF0299 family)